MIRNDADGVVLREPQTGRVVAAVFFAALGGLATILFPDLVAAPLLFAGVALWQAAGLFRIHELCIDAGEHRLTYRHGRRSVAPVYDGTFVALGPDAADDDARLEIVVRAHAGDPGLAASKLRSRRLVLDLHLPGAEPVSFPCGFPMGPNAAADQARGLAERLGLPWRDDTDDGGEDADSAET